MLNVTVRHKCYIYAYKIAEKHIKNRSKLRKANLNQLLMKTYHGNYKVNVVSLVH